MASGGQKKVLQKLHRKQKLFLNAEPESGVQFIDTSSRFVFIGNGGLKNGLSRDLLHALLSKGSQRHGHKPFQIHFYPGKDYSFCTFIDEEHSAIAVATLNGICVQEVCKQHDLEDLLCPILSSGPPLHLYLSFVNKLPNDLKSSALPSGLCPVLVPNELPPGLILMPEFISPGEERAFMEFFTISEVKMTGDDEACEAVPQETLKHRSVKHYGYEFLYGSNNIDPDRPLPGGLPHICTKVLERILHNKLVDHFPDQLTVNQYLPGAGIPPHVDTHSAFEDGIISITLGSHTVMDFRHPGGPKVSVFLQRRSLLIMKGESRYLWTHGIPARKVDTVTSQMLGYERQVNEPPTSEHQQADKQLQESLTPLVAGNRDACKMSGDQATILPRGTRISLTFRKIKRETCSCWLCKETLLPVVDYCDSH